MKLDDDRATGATSPAAATPESADKEPRDRWRGEAPKPIEPRNPPKQQEGPRATFAALKPPSLNLPQGGGALKSIGESYRVSPVTGTASAEIPLPLTPAPHGPTPQLSLAYDSGQGNSVFGLGWNVAVPQVARKTDKQLPQYLDVEESDTFTFGGEDLVPALVPNGSTWIREPVAPVTEGEAPDQITYQITRYRARIEGAHSRIERWTNQTTGETHWRITSRDNTTSYFGTAASSRIAHPSDSPANPANPERVFTWLLDRVVDDRGHVITYHYKAEDLTGVSTLSCSEAHRTDGRAFFANKHLERVRYGNSVPWDPASYKLELAFDYGQHHPSAPTRSRRTGRASSSAPIVGAGGF